MSIRKLLLRSVLLAALGLVPLGASFAEPPAHAPAHGYRAQHRYVYYPEREIYYAPESRLWFWMDGGDWRFGVSLPAPYQQYTSGGISIELGSERPYTEHRYVVERYGKGPKRGGGSKPAGAHKPRHPGGHADKGGNRNGGPKHDKH